MKLSCSSPQKIKLLKKRSSNFYYGSSYGGRQHSQTAQPPPHLTTNSKTKASLQHSKYQFLAHEAAFVQLFWTGKWYLFSKHSLAYSQLGSLNLGASRSNGNSTLPILQAIFQASQDLTISTGQSTCLKQMCQPR